MLGLAARLFLYSATGILLSLTSCFLFRSPPRLLLGLATRLFFRNAALSGFGSVAVTRVRLTQNVKWLKNKNKKTSVRTYQGRQDK